MQGTNRGAVTLVLGGVRSGKSRFAQTLASSATEVVFIATAQAVDAEMRAKIARHQVERPKHWRTLEEPLDLPQAIRQAAQSARCVLVDCLTIYAANLLDTGDGDESLSQQRVRELMEALRTSAASVVLVSNEVGSGVVPPYLAGRQFRDLLGEINQKVAAVADTVVLMVAGLPLVLKGKLEVGQ